MTVDFRDNRGESPTFQIPTAYSVQDGVAVPKSYQGHTKGANYRFYTIEEVNWLKSKEAGYEVKDIIEVCEFKNDSKCSPAHRIDASLFSMHPEILADYHKWKNGVASGITDIKDWDAINTVEMGLLISRGFSSVEHIVATSDQELLTLGLGWKDIKIKAQQHMKKKQMDRDGIAEKAELSEMQKELAKRDAEIAEMKVMIMAMQPKQAKVTLEPEIEVKSEVVLNPIVNKGRRKAGLQG